jgi:hypothetical protein
MYSNSNYMRFTFGAIALLVVFALVLHILNWRRTGIVDWPAAINMIGLFVFLATGAFDPPPGYLKQAFTLLGIALILPSGLWIVFRFFRP